MWMNVWKDKGFIIGFSFLFLLLSASVANTIWNGGEVRYITALYNNERELIGAAPFAPSWTIPLGTDKSGRDVLHMVIQGAKFTISIACIVSILRMMISMIFGIVFGLWFKKGIQLLESLFDGLHVVPLTIIAYFLLVNVLKMPIDGFPNPFWKRAMFEIIILTVLALPPLTIFIAKDIQNMWNKEFMEAAKILGGSKFHMLCTHILPHIFPRLILQCVQQVIQVLLMLIHLGLLQLFFGGTWIDYSPMQEPAKTLSYEWAGIIGQQYKLFFVTPWVVGGPILFLTFTIFALQLIAGAIERVQTKSIVMKKDAK
ncbi:ABC transporter permease subunit [Bacillus sp. FJAT-53711]|uniref:ABC transporter permease subunit n=1 Tax=Bacillus yunxiaonensis TaxID=3127665 RepID=A0ABU8FRI4_9BACI